MVGDAAEQRDDKGHEEEACGQRVRVEPVSYTHLRAHETVLDLVCRLLLEKKKKNNTQPPYSPIYLHKTPLNLYTALKL